MAFNYFNNKSIIGKSIRVTATQGIDNLNSTYYSSVQFVSTSTSFTNNITGTSEVTTRGSVVITYQVTGSIILNWTLNTSSEAGYDFGALTLNSTQLARIAGNPNSQSGNTLMAPGINTLTLTYSKDDSVDAGSDNTTALWSFTKL